MNSPIIREESSGGNWVLLLLVCAAIAAGFFYKNEIAEVLARYGFYSGAAVEKVVVSQTEVSNGSAMTAVVGQPLSSFFLYDSEGRGVSVPGSAQRRPLLVYFYSGMCSHCSQELAKLGPLAQRIETKGGFLVGVEYYGTAESVRRNVAAYSLKGPVLVDVGGKLCGAFGVGDFTVMAVGGDGRLRYRGGIDDPGTVEGMF